jgi:hypothetical protein
VGILSDFRPDRRLPLVSHEECNSCHDVQTYSKLLSRRTNQWCGSHLATHFSDKIKLILPLSRASKHWNQALQVSKSITCNNFIIFRPLDSCSLSQSVIPATSQAISPGVLSTTFSLHFLATWLNKAMGSDGKSYLDLSWFWIASVTQGWSISITSKSIIWQPPTTTANTKFPRAPPANNSQA